MEGISSHAIHLVVLIIIIIIIIIIINTTIYKAPYHVRVTTRAPYNVKQSST